MDKPSIGRIVVYNHPGSADGKFPPMQSPAIIQRVNNWESVSGDVVKTDFTKKVCDLFVMSVTGGIFFARAIEQGDGPSQWNWPVKV